MHYFVIFEDTIYGLVSRDTMEWMRDNGSKATFREVK